MQTTNKALKSCIIQIYLVYVYLLYHFYKVKNVIKSKKSMLWVKETFINDVIFVTLTEIYWGHRKYPNQATKTFSVQQNVYFDLTGLPTANLQLCDYDENRLLELTLRHLYWVMVIDTFVIIKVFNIINYRESYLRRLKPISLISNLSLLTIFLILNC